MADSYIQYDLEAELRQRPVYRPPLGAIDSHVHVFYPRLFPYSPDASYNPVEMTHLMMLRRNRALGLSEEKYLAVGATPTGNDNTTILFAFQRARGQLRSIATVRDDVSDDMLDILAAGGVVGVRYVWVEYLKKEFTLPENVIKMAERVAKHDWVVEVYFEGKDFAKLQSYIETLAGITKVDIDHMGRPDVKGGENGDAYKRYVTDMSQLLTKYADITVKVSGHERLTEIGGDYSDSAAFGKFLVKYFPEQVVWGSDAPHPNMLKTFEKKMPGDARLVNMIPVVAPREYQQEALLITNPNARYFSKRVPVTPELHLEYMKMHKAQYG